MCTQCNCQFYSIPRYHCHREIIGLENRCDDGTNEFSSTLPVGFLIDGTLFSLMIQAASIPNISRIPMIDLAVPTKIGDLVTHFWKFTTNELAKERNIMRDIIRDGLPSEPFQKLIDDKAAYLQFQKNADEEWMGRPPQLSNSFELAFHPPNS